MRAGLGSIIPLQLLTTLSPLEMELRTCGLPYINLEFLKVSGLSQHLLWPSTLSSSHAGGAVLIPTSQLSSRKLREKALTQGHTASKWQSQTLPRLPDSRAHAVSHHHEVTHILAKTPPLLSLACSWPCQLGDLVPVTLPLLGMVRRPAQWGQRGTIRTVPAARPGAQAIDQH